MGYTHPPVRSLTEIKRENGRIVFKATDPNYLMIAGSGVISLGVMALSITLILFGIEMFNRTSKPIFYFHGWSVGWVFMAAFVLLAVLGFGLYHLGFRSLKCFGYPVIVSLDTVNRWLLDPFGRPLAAAREVTMSLRHWKETMSGRIIKQEFWLYLTWPEGEVSVYMWDEKARMDKLMDELERYGLKREETIKPILTDSMPPLVYLEVQ
jgi:hypothetical protein